MPPMGPGGRRRTTEKAKDFKGTMAALLGYVRPHLVGICFSLAFAIVSVVLSVLGPDILGQATTLLFDGLVNMVQGTGGIDFDGIARVLLVLVGLYVCSCGAQFVQGLIMTGVTQRITFRLRADIAAKIAEVPMGYFETHSKGDVLSRITNDVDTLGQSLNQAITQVITCVTQVIGVTVMMFAISPVLAGVTLLTLPVALVIVLVVVRFSQRYFLAQQNELGVVNGIVEEDFGGQSVIQVFDRGEQSATEFDRANDDLYDSAWKSQFYGGIMQPLMNFVSNMGYAAVVIVGAGLAAGGSITIGDIQAFMQYVQNFTSPITQLANVSAQLQAMAAAAERIFEFLGAPSESEPARPETPGARPGAVRFEDVDFGYLPGQTVIHDFSCDVRPGQTVAIVGPTGAGKTTLMKLMMRFYDVGSGRVLVDGEDVRDYERGELRGQFGMVLQDTWLFEGTIRENIRYGRLDATDEEVEEAARIARCDHFIHTLAGGYDFRINEEASNVSQGQRQLLTIARAVLADRPVLILDEATSNVDTRTEVLIQEAMDRLMEGRTSFVVAHRLSTIRNADLILVMRDGNVVEKGTHGELLERNGFYAELYSAQFANCD